MKAKTTPPNMSEIDHKNSAYGNSMQDFQVLSELGRGSYGVVFKV